MSMKGENGNDEVGYLETTSTETDEDTETNEERLQRALAMSMLDENYYEELVVWKENIRRMQLVGQF